MNSKSRPRGLAAAGVAVLLLAAAVYGLPAAASIRFSSTATDTLVASAEGEITQFLKIYESEDVSPPFPYSIDATEWRSYQKGIYDWENSFMWHDGTNGAAVLHRTGLLLPVTAELKNVQRDDTWTNPAITATLTWSDGRCIAGTVQVPPNKCTEPNRQYQTAAVVIEFTQVGDEWHVLRLTQDPAWNELTRDPAWKDVGADRSPNFWTMPRIKPEVS